VSSVVASRSRTAAYSTGVGKREAPVRLTRIYTRGGDAGETSLGDGSRVPKGHPLIRAYGTVDELNSQLGAALAAPDLPEALREPLRRVQNQLFDLGGDLSVPLGDDRKERTRIRDDQVAELERLCDELNEPLPELTSFVLPGGTDAAARLHVARAVARRAEREALAAHEELGVNPAALRYLNRLSDLLFIAARAANAHAGVEEPLWRPGA
jgi:cob(I)alamin adenosyltransferase